jgi:hypothetical protein
VKAGIPPPPPKPLQAILPPPPSVEVLEIAVDATCHPAIIVTPSSIMATGDIPTRRLQDSICGSDSSFDLFPAPISREGSKGRNSTKHAGASEGKNTKKNEMYEIAQARLPKCTAWKFEKSKRMGTQSTRDTPSLPIISPDVITC